MSCNFSFNVFLGLRVILLGMEAYSSFEGGEECESRASALCQLLYATDACRMDSSSIRNLKDLMYELGAIEEPRYFRRYPANCCRTRVNVMGPK